jgi:hypothetical protein
MVERDVLRTLTTNFTIEQRLSSLVLEGGDECEAFHGP